MNKSEYLSQIAHIRKYALEAIQQYDIKEPDVRLVCHGQNTVFKITAQNGKRFVLRVHFADSSHATIDAYLEEMKALSILSKNKKISVPKPIQSKQGEWVVSVDLKNKPILCDLQTWVDGRHLWQGVRVSHIRKMGEAMAEIQNDLKGFSCHHRAQWDANGLLHPKQSAFIGLENMHDLKPAEKTLLLEHNAVLLKKMKQYQKSHPERCGVIHGDLHLNNCLFSKNKISVIDFDDFGYGLYPLPFIQHGFRLRFFTSVERLNGSHEMTMPAI